MGRPVHLDHVQFVSDMAKHVLSGDVGLDEAYLRIKGLTVGPSDLLKDLMRFGRIAVDSHVYRYNHDFKPTAFRHAESIFTPEDSQQSMRALEVVNQMLCHPKAWRLVVLNHLWEKVAPKDLGWLKVFSQHLTAESAYAVMMHLPKTTSRNAAKVIVAREVSNFLPESLHHPVTEIAKSKGPWKVAELFRLAQWDSCREHARDHERDYIFSAELGL